MLTNIECSSALANLYFIALLNCQNEKLKVKLQKEFNVLVDLINEHFELQLTSSECDLIISSLKSLEDELGMDITLLIDKLRKIQSTLPKQEGVVECVEFD